MDRRLQNRPAGLLAAKDPGRKAETVGHSGVTQGPRTFHGAVSGTCVAAGFCRRRDSVSPFPPHGVYRWPFPARLASGRRYKVSMSAFSVLKDGSSSAASVLKPRRRSLF